MFIKRIGLILALACPSSAMAFTCYFTVIKDSCWMDYEVKVDAVDTQNKNVLTRAVIPANKSWTRTSFDCIPGQKMEYAASFSPVFWESNKDAIYKSQQYHQLAAQINPSDVAWDIQVCFPGEFSEVPLPPKGGENCKCDFSVVKPIEKNKG